MNHRNILDIKIPENRQRREFDPKAIGELMKSIEEKGLLHPVVLRADHLTLVSGERRLRAIKLLYAANSTFRCDGRLFSFEEQNIPYITVEDLTPLELEEAELEENVLRKDLTWQENVNAIARLHKLREAQNGKQTIKSTTEELFGIKVEDSGYLRTEVSNALVIDRYLDDPDVAGAASLKEALKIISKKANAIHRELLAREFKDKPSEHTFLCGNAFDLLPRIDERTVDIIITDPPYGVGADNFGGQADATHEYEDSVDYAFQCYQLLFREATRVCKPSAFMFVFCDIRHFQELIDFVDKTWSVWPTPLIWDKENGMLPVPDRGPRRNYEAILYAYRGTRAWLATGVSDVLSEPGLAKPVFGAQKPADLYKSLLAKVSQPGDTVLDPFAGTGPVIGACKALLCRAIAFEMSQAKINYGMITYMGDGDVAD